MKKINFAFAAIVGLMATSCGTSNEEVSEEMEMITPVEYTLNSDASTLSWTGTKKIEEGAHSGTVNITEGSAMVEGDKLTSGEFTIDMTSIKSTDEFLDEGKKEYLASHLASEDFFGAEKYPTVKVKVSEMKDGMLPTTITLQGMEFKKDVPVTTSISEDVMTIHGKFDVDFTGISSPGFQVDPESGEQILPIISYDLHLELTK